MNETSRICPRCRRTVKGECPTCPKPGKVYDQKRGNATQRGYDRRWQKARKAYLVENPLCEVCLKKGITEAAEVVDHIKPHKGDMSLFWNVENWQSMSIRCHNIKTGRGE